MSRSPWMKTLRYLALGILIFAPLAYFAPYVVAAYAIFGLYDVTRNTALDGFVVRRYFMGNGVLTWLLSPLNTLFDLLALPYLNKGVYELNDLPPGHRQEVERLIAISKQENLAKRLEERAKEFPRAMIFFKWYGQNVDTFLDVPAFHEKWRYVQTIGISVFNKKVLTSKHFGPLRATFRVLYNINDIDDLSTYIVVGDVTSYWADSKLFIFDDTLMHQSVNNTDQTRYCLFVDIVRPSLFSFPYIAVVRTVRFFARSMNYLFYRNWEVIGR